MKTRKKMKKLALSAIIAALYVVLTFLSYALGLSGGAVQIRFSEALTILPLFTSASIPGLFIGCIISNILTGCAIWDIIFGSLATLLGAVGTYYLRNRKLLCFLPPILSNTVIIPAILLWVYSLSGTYWYFALTVFVGEFISCGILGVILKKGLEKRNINLK